jgi:hypothetical protein
MARPPLGAEPMEPSFQRRPSLPPFSKFLSDAGNPDLFSQANHYPTRTEPSLSNGTSSLIHAMQPNQLKPSDLHPVAPVETPSNSSIGQSDIRHRHHWSCPGPSQPQPAGSRVRYRNYPVPPQAGRVLLREEHVVGMGPCYIYNDGTVIQRTFDRDAFNPHWGTTKAGKPRKRLGQACNTCREKKIKCDPSVPKCHQCQRFGRECKFET